MMRAVFSYLASPARVASAFVLLSLLATQAFAEPHAEQNLTETTFVDIAEKTLPSVVAVYVTKDISEQLAALQDDPRFKRFFEEQPEGSQPNPHADEEMRTSGSGVIISEDGYIVTNLHIIVEAEDDEISVVLNDDTEFLPSQVKVVARDNLMDLAVLKVDVGDRKLPPLKWGDSSKTKIGEWVVAIGNPLDLRGSVSKGIISAKSRQIEKVPIENLIQTDAMINPGNSGGALVNLDGDLIGINMAIATRSGFFQGIGFAIPSNDARFVIDQVIEHGRVRRGYIGIEMSNIAEDLAKGLGLGANKTPRGVLVTNVVDDAPAAKAGVEPYDVILEVDSRAINTTNDLLAAVASKSVGSEAELKILRKQDDENEEKMLVMKVTERPPQDEIWRQRESLRELQAAAARPREDALSKLGLLLDPVSGGALNGLEVHHIRPQSPAARSGLASGDIILEINRQRVESVDDATEILDNTPADEPLIIRAVQNGAHSVISIDR